MCFEKTLFQSSHEPNWFVHPDPGGAALFMALELEG